MTIRLADELRGSISAFWATTFTFEVSTFEDFVLPRISGGSLSATVLADASRLSAEWDRLAATQSAVRANRDYLVRGISARGSFHPKTVLLATPERARLLVGSGNLTLSGLEMGEVFTQFESGSPLGNEAISAWRVWMQQVVMRSEDLDLERRWREVAGRLPDVGAASPDSPFVSNLERPILDSLAIRLPPPPVDELYVAAPFWDEDCSAFTTLADYTRPNRIVLYFHERTSVNGELLRAALERMPTTDILIRSWDSYVHAKLIGVVKGDEGVLLSGSPNLSDAALTLFGDQPGANSETATIARGSAEDIRAFFHPPSIKERVMSLSELGDFRRQPPVERGSYPVRLLAAVRQGDGRVKVTTGGPLPPSSSLSNGTVRVALTAEGLTVEPLDLAKGRFVRTLSASDEELSNAVPVDLPDHLRAFAGKRRDTSKPTGLEPGDMDSPLGWLLGWLHGECVFDIDEAVPRHGSESADEEEVDSIAGDDFWDRLQRDELRRDPRLGRYSRMGTYWSPLDDEVFLFLRMLLNQVPSAQVLRLIRGEESGEEDIESAPGVKWSPAARIRVRVFNVLARWIKSLGDPHLTWLDPLAPVRNFSALAGALLYCWLHDYLQEARLARLTHSLLAAIAGSDQSTGFLDSFDSETLERANEEIDQQVRDTIATLSFVAVKTDRQADPRAVFDWQPALRNALRLGLLTPSHVAAAVSGVLIGKPLTPEELVDDIQWAASYEDDVHWCHRMGVELELSALELRARSVLAEGYGVHLSVEAGIDLLGDPRIPRLVRDALRYREADGALIESGENRLSISTEGPVLVRKGRRYEEILGDLDSDDLALLVELGAGFADLVTTSRTA